MGFSMNLIWIVGAKTTFDGNEPKALRPEKRETNLCAAQLYPRNVAPESGFITAAYRKRTKVALTYRHKRQFRFDYILTTP